MKTTTSTLPAPQQSIFTALIALKETFKARLTNFFKIPLGYEDETGFHYGVDPRTVAQYTHETTHDSAAKPN